MIKKSDFILCAPPESGARPLKDHQAALAFVFELVARARHISLAHYDAQQAAEAKPDKSLVTEVDRTIEIELGNMAADHGWGIVGEEFGARNTHAEYVVVLDPIDGTDHFITHDDNFFTLIGVYHKTDGFVIGVCDQPATPHIWTAVKGFGAYKHRKNEDGGIILSEKIVPQTGPAPLAASILATYDPTSLNDADRYFYEEVADKAMTEVAGGDGGNYARVAEGRVNIVLEHVGGLHDVAAFIPMLAETGGAIKQLLDDGTVADIDITTQGSIKVLAASCAPLMNDLVKLRKQNLGTYRELDQAVKAAKAGVSHLKKTLSP